MNRLVRGLFLGGFLLTAAAGSVLAQEESTEESSAPEFSADAGSPQAALKDTALVFTVTGSQLPPPEQIQEILWDFGDAVRATGEKVTHTYEEPGTYLVQVTVTTEETRYQDTTEVRIFPHVLILLADASASDEELKLSQQQAAEEDLLLRVIKAKNGGPEVLIEEELTLQLLDARTELAQADVLVVWTSGGVGANVLSKFAQHLRQGEENANPDLRMSEKGIVILSQTPFAVLKRTAQSAFDQLEPAYVLLTRPHALSLLFSAATAEEARDALLTASVEHVQLGRFSQRAITDIGLTNFMSFGLNFLVNRGVPINNIILILMLPVIATILSFTRQVIGIKAFGLITPAMTTLSFLVMGLEYGLAVFVVVLLSGTLTRILMRRLRLLYLPRMALVLTSVSLAILVLLGLGVVTERAATLSFSIFPILILTILAEEFIAVQFKAGARTALTTTAWTLFLSILCYYIVSWELLRTLLLSYPESILLAIPINILLGRWTGLRLTEYFRFRHLLRYGSSE